MARTKVAEEDLDLLTDEERVGLKELQAEEDAEREAAEAEIEAQAAGDDSAEGGEEPAKKPDKKPDKKAAEKPQEAEEEKESEAEQPAKPEAEEADGEEKEEAGEGEGETEAEGNKPAAAQAKPPVTYKLTEADEKRISEIKKQMREAAQRFDDGELTAMELRDQSDKLQDELDTLKDKRTLAMISSEQAVEFWQKVTVPNFLKEHAEYKEGSLRYRLLDDLVRDAQIKLPDPTDPQTLADAHAKIVAELGEIGGAKPAKTKPNGNGRTLPPNLNNIPAAEQTEAATNNKFERLDRLSGEAYERAFARPSAEDREAYLRFR